MADWVECSECGYSGAIDANSNPDPRPDRVDVCPNCASKIFPASTPESIASDAALPREAGSANSDPEIRRGWSEKTWADHQPGGWRQFDTAWNADSSRVSNRNTSFPKIPGFQIIELIASGGMGVVYRAFEIASQRQVAIKAVSPEASLDAMSRKRFELEADTLARLTHPNIVQLHRVVWADHRPFMILEFVEIASLDDVIRVGTLPARVSAGLVQRIAEAIRFTHEQGVVHRDLKPSNILMDRAEKSENDEEVLQARIRIVEGLHEEHFDLSRVTPKIADFGLVGRLAESVAVTRLTHAGALMGTPGYLAPESISQKSGTLTCQVDVYGLGGVLYACLTGKPPFTGANLAEVIQKILNEPLVPPKIISPNLPEDLNTICLKCLEKDPAERYQTAAEVVADLERFRQGKPIMARPPGVVRKLVKWYQGNRWPALFTGLFLILGLSVTGWIANAKYQSTQKQRFWEMEAVLKEESAKIAGRLNSEMVVVQSLSAFIGCQDQFSHVAFQQFCQPLVEQHQNLKALEWAPLVTQPNREQHEMQGRKTIRPDYTIHSGKDAADRWQTAPIENEYYPVFAAYPVKGNEAALGLNLAFEQQRQSALQSAIEQDRPGLSGPIRLVQDQEEQIAFLGFVPTWQQVTGNETQGVKGELRGLAVGVFQVQALIEPILEDWNLGKRKQYDLQIYDVTHQKELLFTSKPITEIPVDALNAQSATINALGRAWDVVFYDRNPERASQNGSLAIIFGIGFLLTLMSAGAPLFISLIRKSL